MGTNATSSRPAARRASAFYTFHPEVEWQSDYPRKREILDQVWKLWRRYELSSRTSFGCKVNRVWKEDRRWVVNDYRHGYFDGIIAAVGTCGEIREYTLQGQQSFVGEVVHSSQLDETNVTGKRVVVVGAGASAAEAMEYACDHGAAHTKVVSRSQRWLIPRHPLLNALLAALIADPFGLLASVVEYLVRIFSYGDLSHMAPSKSCKHGIFASTPVVNSRVLELVRSGSAEWLQGDIKGFDTDGIRYTPRGSMASDTTTRQGSSNVAKADLCILATGYARPSLSFLPSAFFKDPRYSAPNWYMQNFPTDDATLCCLNCTWLHGIGAVGGAHITIYTRFLLAFLLDPATRPSSWWMRRWVDWAHLVKKPLPGGALAFVSSAEMYCWFLFAILLQPALWPWARFRVGEDIAEYLIAWQRSSTLSTVEMLYAKGGGLSLMTV
ncbi:hypothetical protein LTR85_000394 [Meristemomyces frigidus]|nr:hypothetical protein LTR85_000394 [Meristemomyces frigidus]